MKLTSLCKVTWRRLYSWEISHTFRLLWVPSCPFSHRTAKAKDLGTVIIRLVKAEQGICTSELGHKNRPSKKGSERTTSQQWQARRLLIVSKISHKNSRVSSQGTSNHHAFLWMVYNDQFALPPVSYHLVSQMQAKLKIESFKKHRRIRSFSKSFFNNSNPVSYKLPKREKLWERNKQSNTSKTWVSICF